MKSYTRRVRRARFTSKWGRAVNDARRNSTGKPLTVAYLAKQSSYARVS